MNHQSPPPTPDAGAINELAMTAVRSHRIKLRILTTLALVLGIATIAASIYIASFWVMLKSMQVEAFRDFPKSVEQAKRESTEESLKRINKMIQIEAFLTHMASTQATALALAVVMLGLGMLILLTVVVLNRRVTLNQVNNSLAQISNQLLELKTVRGSP